ncbi:hypothetical protein [Streptomyces sp. H10-C2]|uniref:hypothetical protein n=1 Tax=Streptomyces sp. H10-C2 TaxID=3046210 RepID=UPI0024B8F3E7|nr:hypothetical protein [Streptomyces sp. H10-C2]
MIVKNLKALRGTASVQPAVTATKALQANTPMLNSSQLISSSCHHERAFIHAFTAAIMHIQPPVDYGRVRLSLAHSRHPAE